MTRISKDIQSTIDAGTYWCGVMILASVALAAFGCGFVAGWIMKMTVARIAAIVGAAVLLSPGIYEGLFTGGDQ